MIGSNILTVEGLAHRYNIPERDVYLLAAIAQHSEYSNFFNEEMFSSELAKTFFLTLRDSGLSGIAAAQLGILYSELIALYVPSAVDVILPYAQDSYAYNLCNSLITSLGRAAATGRISYDEFRTLLIDYLHKLSTIGVGNKAEHLQSAFKAAMEYSKRSVGVSIPYSKLAEYVDTLSQDMVVVGARTSVGKTSFALDMTRRMASYGVGVYVVSLEMDKYAIAARLVSAITKKAYRDVLTTISDYEIDKLRNYNIYIQDSAQAVADNVPLYFAEAQSLGCKVLVLDYIQLLYPRRRNERRDLEIAYASALIRDSIRRYNVSAITLAQLNRIVEARADGKPRLSDLRDSGSIEMDADIVLLLSRDEEKVNVRVAKNRNGRVGEFLLYFNKEQMSFTEDYEQPQDHQWKW